MPVTVDVSVIVPCRNAATTLPAQLEALARQRFDGTWELIVVDDASNDNTPSLLEQWGGRMENMSVLRLARGGSASRARNAGIGAARGSLLLFCDADDVVAPGWIEAHAEALRTYELTGGPMRTDALNPALFVRPTTIREPSELPMSAGYRRFVPSGNLGVRRQVALALKGFDDSTDPCEDQDFSWRAVDLDASLGFAPGAMVQVRWPSSLKALWRQRLKWNASFVGLFVKNRDRGMPARTARQTLGALAFVIRRLPGIVTRRGRVVFVAAAGGLAGRVVGSVRYRTLYI